MPDKKSDQAAKPCESNADLDVAFSCSKWSLRFGQLTSDELVEDLIQRCADESDKFLAEGNFQSQRNLAYGPDEREKVDIFSPKETNKDAPVFMFLHGGYWQAENITKDNNCLMGAPLIKNGAVLVTVGYSLAPKYTVQDMVEQVIKAVVFVAKKFPETRGLYISGHSAGAHLAAMMLSVDWSSLLGGTKHIVKGIIPVSGIFDVRPITKTYINEPLLLTESSAATVSPLLLVNNIPKCNYDVRVRILLAQYDSPTFHEQAKEYTKLLASMGLHADMAVVPGKDHFEEIIETPDENCILQKEFLQVMGLK